MQTRTGKLEGKPPLTTSTHGGRRPGAGRPPGTGLFGEAMIARLIKMPPDYWFYLQEELGGYSSGIRQLIEEHQEREYQALNKRRPRKGGRPKKVI